MYCVQASQHWCPFLWGQRRSPITEQSPRWPNTDLFAGSAHALYWQLWLPSEQAWLILISGWPSHWACTAFLQLLCQQITLPTRQLGTNVQDLRQHFIPGVLSEEELGNKLHVHVLTQEYVARVSNPRSYDAVSRDILQRWCFPFAPDTNLLPMKAGQGLSSYSYQRHHMYR